jgi:DNA-binding NarL/FixJ family response regulator
VIEVLLVDDDVVLRDGLAALIADEPDLRSTRQHGSIEEALRSSGPPPDVILLDIHMPGLLGSAGVVCLVEKYPRACVLMLTVTEDERHIFESICNGASGYLLKSTPPPRILEAIRSAAAGGAPMSPEVARKVLAAFRQLRPVSDDHGLTPKERELLALLADGHSYLNAAHTLGITINTVRNHVRSIYDKLHVHTKSEAVAKALKHGILR